MRLSIEKIDGFNARNLKTRCLLLMRQNTTLKHLTPTYVLPDWTTLLVRKNDAPHTDVPTPSTLAILGLGLLGLVARRKLF